MGTTESYKIKATGQSVTPVDLSAIVLNELKTFLPPGEQRVGGEGESAGTGHGCRRWVEKMETVGRLGEGAGKLVEHGVLGHVYVALEGSQTFVAGDAHDNLGTYPGLQGQRDERAAGRVSGDKLVLGGGVGAALAARVADALGGRVDFGEAGQLFKVAVELLVGERA